MTDEQKPKRKRQKRGDVHYVNNKEFTLALDEYAREYKACVAEDKEKPQMSRYLGECVIKMANRLASTPRFYGYSYRDEMIQNAILGAVKYMHRFDGDRFNNGFAYVTQICYYAFLRRIQKEKKQVFVKQEILKETGLSEAAFDTIDGDTTGMSNTNIEWFQDNLNPVNYEPRTSKNKAKKTKKNLDNFTE